jgi:hypothetical protein
MIPRKWPSIVPAILVPLAAVSGFGCEEPPWNRPNATSTDFAGSAEEVAGGAADEETGLPCDVERLLASRCATCHSRRPTGGAPMPLVTYADLAKPSTSDPTKTVAQLSLARARSQERPMPPGSPLPSAQFAPFVAWVEAGAPKSACIPAVLPTVEAGPGTFPPECKKNDECPSPLVCKRGFCDVECASSTECGGGLECRATRCVRRSSRDASLDGEPTDSGTEASAP